MRTVLNKDTVERIAALYDADYDKPVFPADYLVRSHPTREELTAAGYTFPARGHLTVEDAID